MSLQHKEVYTLCHEVVDELLDKGQQLEAAAVLRSLGVYLDQFPAFADGSCRRVTENKLTSTVALIDSHRKKKA